MAALESLAQLRPAFRKEGTVTAGALIGTAVGMWMGGGLTDLYRQFFHFPVLVYRLDVSWTSVEGPRRTSYHVEVRPGPDGVGACFRLWIPAAGPA